MPYSSNKICLYGVNVSNDVAKALVNDLGIEQRLTGQLNFDVSNSHTVYRRIHPDWSARGPQQFPISECEAHQMGMPNMVVFNPKMLADNVDNRIHHSAFEPGFDHYLGIFLGQSKFSQGDDVNALLAEVPELAKENFETIIRPLIEKYGIPGNPQARIITQID